MKDETINDFNLAFIILFQAIFTNCRFKGFLYFTLFTVFTNTFKFAVPKFCTARF